MKCAVQRAYDAMTEGDREVFAGLIQDPYWSAGMIARALQVDGHEGVDRAAVGHYRRKLRAGKAAL